MHAEPAEWHSFGDAPPAAVAVAPAGTPAAATAGPQGATAVTQVKQLRDHAVGQTAWFAAGATVLSVVVGVAVFVTTLTFAGGPRDQVVIAARGTPVASGQAAIGARPSAGAEGATAVAPATLLVDVEGAVREPGLHRVPAGSRVGDAIAAAGGYADRADLEAAARTLNLAEPLADGAKIRVPLIGDMPLIGDSPPHIDLGPGASQPADGSPAATGLVDLNHADEAALDSLPGIGPVTAAKIIGARENAPFASLDELVTRDVLSASVLDKIRALATVTP